MIQTDMIVLPRVDAHQTDTYIRPAPDPLGSVAMTNGVASDKRVTVKVL